jgi:hypothetical protein
MPALENPRHEKFARLWHQSGNSSRSYKIAFGHSEPQKWHTVEGCRLLAKPSIERRIAELKRETIKRADVTVDRILAELEEGRLLASEQHKPAAMIAATVSKARLCGLLVDKRQSRASSVGIEGADSLPELFDQVAIQFGRPVAVAFMAALENILGLLDLETMETEGNA